MENNKRIKLNENKSFLEHLPMEIYLKIFNYLRGEDIKNLRLVCRYLNNITQTLDVGKRLQLKLVSIGTDLFIDDFIFFQKSTQTFYNVSLKRCYMDVLVPLFEVIGKNTISLYIDESQFSSDNVLKEILKFTPNIKELTLKFCSFSHSMVPTYDEIFANIKILIFLNNAVTKTNYGEVSNIINYIKENSLTILSLNYVYKYFRSEINITHLMEMIQRNKISLVELHLLDCCFEKEEIGSILWQSLQKLQFTLKSFSTSHIPQNASSRRFIEFLILQKNLKYLKLTHVRALTDDDMEIIVNNLVNLEEIEFIDCVGLTNKGIAVIENLKKLNTLKLYFNCEYFHKVTIVSLINGIARQQNFLIKELAISNIEMKIEQLHEVIKNLPNLVKLKCHTATMSVINEGLEISKILSNNRNIANLSFVNNNTSHTKTNINQVIQAENTMLRDLELSNADSFRELLMLMNLPNLENLQLSYHNRTARLSEEYNLMKALYKSSPLIEHISFTVLSDMFFIVEYVLHSFKKLKLLSLGWYCKKCHIFQNNFVKLNQTLHPFLKKSSIDRLRKVNCSKCNKLYYKWLYI